MSDVEEAPGKKADPPPYIIFVVVFLFFVTGLCGFLVCHLLKLKGYRCTMEDDEDDEEELEEGQEDEDEENQDTVEKILKCIIENEANMEAFNEMVGKGNVCVRHDPRLRKESIGGLPPHMHTVHSGTDLHDTCHLCAQIRNKRARRPSRTPRFRRPGEQTVFSVGRFRVTHTDKKSADGGGRIPDVLVGSGDNLDQSQDSEERRDGGYNLRSLFKDSRPPSESTNGVASNTGKRRRSLTIFGLRRGSDPIGVKVVGAGKEGVRFIPQPVVLEEPQNENGENGSKVVSKVRRGSLEIAASRIKVTSNSSAIKTEAKTSVVSEGSTQGIRLQTKDVPALVTPSPNSLPMPLTSSIGEETDEQTNLSPGPLQTSTPLSPLPDPAEQIIQFIPQDLPGSQTPPDPCTSPVQEHNSFASPALISLGSSPHLTLRTPTSPAAPSSIFSAQVSSQPASSPKLLSSQPSKSNKSMNSPQTSSPSVSLQDDALALEMTSKEPNLTSSVSQMKPDGFTTQMSTEKAELTNLEGDKSPSQLSSLALEVTNKEPSLTTSMTLTKLEGSTVQMSKEKAELKNLGTLEGDISPSQLSSPSPLGGRVSSVTIIKASPDSKREFSVATMVEDQGETSKVDAQESVDSVGEKVTWTLGDEKEEIVEMEEIAECRVTQAGEIGTEKKATLD